MKVSVIMSVYNAEKYLEASISSILNQFYSDFELIIINDKATDSSDMVMQKYQMKDKRIVVLENEQNLGLTKSLNRGLRIAKGEYIARMDADDIALPEWLAECVCFLDRHPDYTFVGCVAQYIDENGNPEQMRLFPETNEQIYDMMPKVNAVMHSGVLFRKEDVKKIGNYCEDYRVVQDWDLWFRGMAAGYKFYNIQKPLIRFRRNDSYNARKNMAYRMTEVKVCWKGYQLNHVPARKRIYIVVPLVLAFIPTPIIDRLFYTLKRFDPRNNQRGNVYGRF